MSWGWHVVSSRAGLPCVICQRKKTTAGIIIMYKENFIKNFKNTINTSPDYLNVQCLKLSPICFIEAISSGGNKNLQSFLYESTFGRNLFNTNSILTFLKTKRDASLTCPVALQPYRALADRAFAAGQRSQCQLLRIQGCHVVSVGVRRII